MEIIVYKDDFKVIDDININSGSIRYYNVSIKFDNSWDGLTKKAILVSEDESLCEELAIINDRVYIDTNKIGHISIGFVGYKIEEEKKVFQISTRLRRIYSWRGAGSLECIEHEIPSLTEWEKYIKQIEDMISNMSYDNINNKPSINGVTLEGALTNEQLHIKQDYKANDIPFEDGETFQEKYNKGELVGPEGPQGIPGPKGQNGVDGQPGKDGVNGKDGKTPIKGTDYFTEADKQEIENGVISVIKDKLGNKLVIKKSQGYNYTFELLNPEGVILSSDTIDLPIEDLVSNEIFEQKIQDINNNIIENKYKLPIASSSVLGGVKPVFKTPDMVEPVRSR